MAKWTNNQSAVFEEFQSGYDLPDLKRLAASCGLSNDDLKGDKAKRVSARSAAYALATKVPPAKVRAEAEAMGFDLSDMPWDHFEGSDNSCSNEGGVSAESKKPKDESKDESKGESKDESKDESKGDEVRDQLSEYFGGGQLRCIDELFERLPQQSSQAGPTFKVEMPDVDLREIEGTPPEYFEEMLDMAACRLPILLVGPTGCGKTHAAAMLAEALDMAFASVSCTEGMSEANLTGWLLPVGDGGQFTYIPAMFVHLFEHGGVFLLDEVDASDANTLLIMNAAVANGILHIPQRHESPTVKKHKDFVLIAAANTYGNGANMQFVGRNKLDTATLDRFKAGTITCDYEPKVEEQLIDAEILEWGRKMRERIENADLEQSLSTRFMRDLSMMHSVKPDKYGRPFWEQQLTQGWSPDEITRVIY